jgi:hypothetical protein
LNPLPDSKFPSLIVAVYQKLASKIKELKARRLSTQAVTKKLNVSHHKGAVQPYLRNNPKKTVPNVKNHSFKLKIEELS